MVVEVVVLTRVDHHLRLELFLNLLMPLSQDRVLIHFLVLDQLVLI